MTRGLLHRLATGGDFIATCMDYKELLAIAHRLFGYDYDYMREHYGQYTYKQWAQLIAQRIK